LGVVYDKKGQFNEAIFHYEQALRIKPEYPKALSNLGIIYGRMEKLNRAIELFKKSLKIAPDDPITLFNLAFAYERLAKSYERRAMSEELIVKAIETYQKVLNIDPENAQANERMRKLRAMSVEQRAGDTMFKFENANMIILFEKRGYVQTQFKQAILSELEDLCRMISGFIKNLHS